MSKQKLLLIAYRAFGDWLYSIPILPFLFKEYEVYLECNKKVYSLAYDDPRFAGISVFNDTLFLNKALSDSSFDKDVALSDHMAAVMDRVKPDRVIDLSFSHESKTIASNHQKEFSMPVADRQAIYGNKDYYEAVFKHVGIDMPDDLKLDTMYYSESQHGFGERWRKLHTSDFLVMIPLLGSCMQKVYLEADAAAQHIVDKYHNAHVYLMGEEGILEVKPEHERIHDITGRLSIKQSMLMLKYADYVIGPETGLLVAAGMWGTPKTMLCNTINVKQCNGRHENDYSLQSSWVCSPCHKGIYVEADCDDVAYADDTPYSACVGGYKQEDIYAIIDEVYNKKNIYNKDYLNKYVTISQTELGAKIYEQRWDLIRNHCLDAQTLIDYGCASGAFIQSEGSFLDTQGYDVNPYSPYHQHPEPKSYDILTLWDVIEHLHEPEAPILKYAPEYIFISTPNLHENVVFDEWKHNRPGEHLHYFDEISLVKFLDTHGYKVLETNFGEGQLRDPEKPKDIITMVAKKK